MKIVARVGQVSCRIFFAIAFATVLWLGRTATAQASIINGASNNIPELIPEIHFSDVPITTAIEHFAALADENYLLSPNLFASRGNAPGSGIPEPNLNLNWTNISARNALAQLLKEHDLVAVEDRFSAVTLIVGAHHAAFTNVVDARLLVSDDETNEPIPMIIFMDVPLNEGLTNLIAHDDLKVVLDPKVADDTDPKHPVPMVSVRWKNLTAKQAVAALCRFYGLIVVKDMTTGVVSIKPAL